VTDTAMSDAAIEPGPRLPVEAAPHPNDYWIVSNYFYKPWATLDEAKVALESLRTEFPKKAKRFHIVHCKRRMTFSQSGEKIAALLEALKAMTDRWEPDTGGADRRMWEAARDAIAKATGDAP
jgi:hypothetical protein